MTNNDIDLQIHGLLRDRGADMTWEDCQMNDKPPYDDKYRDDKCDIA